MNYKTAHVHYNATPYGTWIVRRLQSANKKSEVKSKLYRSGQQQIMQHGIDITISRRKEIKTMASNEKKKTQNQTAAVLTGAAPHNNVIRTRETWRHISSAERSQRNVFFIISSHSHRFVVVVVVVSTTFRYLKWSKRSEAKEDERNSKIKQDTTHLFSLAIGNLFSMRHALVKNIE